MQGAPCWDCEQRTSLVIQANPLFAPHMSCNQRRKLLHSDTRAPRCAKSRGGIANESIPALPPWGSNRGARGDILHPRAEPAAAGPRALAGYCHTPKSLTRNLLPVLRNCQRMWGAKIANAPTPTSPSPRRFPSARPPRAARCGASRALGRQFRQRRWEGAAWLLPRWTSLGGCPGSWVWASRRAPCSAAVPGALVLPHRG